VSTVTTNQERLTADVARRLRDDIQDAHFHPLETIEVFRRWPRSFFRNVVYTCIFNLMFAALFTVLALVFTRIRSAEQFWNIVGNNVLISNVIGFAFWGVLEVIHPLMRRLHLNPIFQAFPGIVALYSVIGTVVVTGSFYLVSLMPGFTGMQSWVLKPQQLVSSFVISLIVSLVIASVWRRRADELNSQIALAEERERVAAAERAATQASLRALQAQIEPHFLFNTLANVTSLIHTRPDDAKRILEEFIAYLRASLANTREESTTLDREFALMQSFLAILKIRMGARLSTRVEIDEATHNFAMPPMLIQPLVENAIKHGLEPKIEGGEVVLSAKRVGDTVYVTVADTGMGFKDSGSSGIGLKNVRERLEKLFEGRASMTIEDNKPSGTRITMAIPAP
jgi:sensor histidine kinase YesM